jgi:phosphohistidine phosphatase
MKKQLLLMRHAKSGWDDPAMADFDRTLAERGRKDAPEMGKRLLAAGFVPQLILSSTAKRARKTADLVAEQIQYDPKKIEFESDIYEADISDLIHVIRNLGDEHTRVMLVGHNPAFTGLVGYLSDKLIENMPTSGMALLSFSIESWKQVNKQTATLKWFDFPKNHE